MNKPKSKDCWYNSQQFVIECGDFRYFEGYVQLPRLIPLEHAWVLMDDDRVLDFTLEAMQPEMEEHEIEMADALYLGVEIPWQFVRTQVVETESNMSFAEADYATLKPKRLRKK